MRISIKKFQGNLEVTLIMLFSWILILLYNASFKNLQLWYGTFFFKKMCYFPPKTPDIAEITLRPTSDVSNIQYPTSNKKIWFLESLAEFLEINFSYRISDIVRRISDAVRILQYGCSAIPCIYVKFCILKIWNEKHKNLQ